MSENQANVLWLIEVFPKRPADSDSLRALGEALRRWAEEVAATIMDLDREGIDDLTAGELPRPHGLYSKPRIYVGRTADGDFEMPTSEELAKLTPQQVIDKLMEGPKKHRSISVRLRGGMDFDTWKHDTAISLRKYVDPSLVDDIKLHGESWAG